MVLMRVYCPSCDSDQMIKRGRPRLANNALGAKTPLVSLNPSSSTPPIGAFARHQAAGHCDAPSCQWGAGHGARAQDQPRYGHEGVEQNRATLQSSETCGRGRGARVARGLHGRAHPLQKAAVGSEEGHGDSTRPSAERSASGAVARPAGRGIAPVLGVALLARRVLE